MIRVAELRTTDGYIIDSSAIVGDVLRDDDIVEVSTIVLCTSSYRRVRPLIFVFLQRRWTTWNGSRSARIPFLMRVIWTSLTTSCIGLVLEYHKTT